MPHVTEELWTLLTFDLSAGQEARRFNSRAHRSNWREVQAHTG